MKKKKSKVFFYIHRLFKYSVIKLKFEFAIVHWIITETQFSFP